MIITPLLIQEGWRAGRRGGYLLKPKTSRRNQPHPLPSPQLRKGVFPEQPSLRTAILRAASPMRPNPPFSPRVWKGGASQAAEKLESTVILRSSGDEESRIPLKMLRARSFASLRTTALVGFSAACSAPPLQAVLIFPVSHTPHSLQPQAVWDVRQTEGRCTDFGGAEAPPFLQPPNSVLGSREMRPNCFYPETPYGVTHKPFPKIGPP